MKSVKLIIAALVIANVCIAASPRVDGPKLKSTFGSIDEVEVLSLDEQECYRGGRGVGSCMLDAGIEFEEGISGSCSITCGPGFYACCNFYCECRPNKNPSLE